MSDPEYCPKCGEECERDEVDIGIGIQYGPYGCGACGWSSIDTKAIEAAHQGWYCDPWDSLHKIEVIVTRLEHFGLDGDHVRDVFKN